MVNLVFSKSMDPSRFYGHCSYTNLIPGDGSQSNDELASDSDSEYLPPPRPLRHKRHVIIPDTDSSESEQEQASICSVQVQSSVTKNGKSGKDLKTKIKKKKSEKVIWKKDKMTPYDENNFKFSGDENLPDVFKQFETPAHFFGFLFTNDLIEFIVNQSNLKALQDNINKPANISHAELEQFIGTVIYMSIVKLPSSRRYWSKTEGQSAVYETMTCNRWETIKRFLHFNNNDEFQPPGSPDYDKLFKVRPLLQKIRDRLLLIPKEEYMAVDEQIIPTKHRHEIKQYNPAKPHKWGYKNLVLSGVSGFSYDFDIFAGVQSNTVPNGAPDLGVSANVVTRLTETVPRNMNHKIFFDNWFNCPNLQVYLYKQGLLPLGTVRLNRVPNSEMPTEKTLKKLGRGGMLEKTVVIDDVKLSLVSWFDNKQVNMLSAYVGSEPMTTKRRYFKKDNEYRMITSPQAVDVYNRHMGGVDLLDSLLGLYRIQLRSRKWYKKIFFHMLDMTVVNAWLLWRRCNDVYMPLYDFKLAVSEHLRKSGKCLSKKRGRPSTSGTPQGTPTTSRASTPNIGSPTVRSKCQKNTRKRPARHQDTPLISVRTDTVGHFPKWMKNRQLCQNNCTFRSFTVCEKCQVHLCYNEKRNCFKDYHLV